MARILIGNIKGPKGNQGIQGIQGPIGPVGPQGPLPPLANNGLTTQVGVAALDAAYGKTLADGLSSVNSEMLSTKEDFNSYKYNESLISPIYIGAKNKGYCITSRTFPISFSYTDVGEIEIYVNDGMVGKIQLK